MKQRVLPFLVFAMVIVPLATSSAHRKNRSFGLGDSTTPTFADYDADGDGLISAQEIADVKAAEAAAKEAAAAEAAAAKAEADAAAEAAALAEFDGAVEGTEPDGVLDDAEADLAKAAAKAAAAEARAAEKAAAEAVLLAEFDADENGVLDIVEQAKAKAASIVSDAEEALAAVQVRFDEIDGDADGQITLAELQFALPLESVELLYNTILSYDEDLSLSISLAEFSTKPLSKSKGRWGHKSKKSKHKRRGRR